MVTKWKSFNRSSAYKSIINLLIIVLITVITMRGITFLAKVENGILDDDVLYTPSYEKAMYYNDIWAFNKEIMNSDVEIQTEDFNYIVKKDGQILQHMVNNGVDNGKVFVYSKNENGDVESSENITYQAFLNDPKAISYVQMTEKAIEEKQANWDRMTSNMIDYIVEFIAEGVMLLVLVILASISAGRRVEDDEVHLIWIDGIYSDVLAVVGIVILSLPLMMLGMISQFIGLDQMSDTVLQGETGLKNLQGLALAGEIGITVLSATWVLWIYLSLIRKIKAKNLFTHTLCWTVCYKLFWKKIVMRILKLCKRILLVLWGMVKGTANWCISFIDGRKFKNYPFLKSMERRQVWYTIVQGLLVGVAIVAAATDGWPVPIIVAILCLINAVIHIRANQKTFQDVGKICDQIREVNAGELMYLPPMEVSSPLYESRKLLAKIGNGMQNSVDKAIKSEKMKIDLVTNVSHDLKTPLTSIISYVDLLSKDESLSEEAKGYVAILGQKSDRLKHIVSDLFELAKSTSGNDEINLEKINLNRLIEQTTADMVDTMEKSGRILRVRMPEDVVNIKCDGNKIYRVLQNILDNALKYSLEGSRVFVDLERKDGKVRASVKSTAAYEMDFTAEDVLERFSRGDKARSTEGSGLGLSIAESFTKASGGKMEVSVDGDLFKVTLIFDEEV